MFSIGVTMLLRPGCYDEYKKHHDEIWPDLAQSMSDNEVSMAIFRLEDRLFLHAAAPTEAHWQRSREVPVLARWGELMKTLLQTDAEGSIIFDELEPTFGFGLFKSD